MILWLAIAALLILALSGAIVHLLTESWWFRAVGYPSVFWTRIRWQSGIWVVTGLFYSAFLYGNYRLALRLTRDAPWRVLEGSNLAGVANTLPQYLAIAFTMLLSLNAAVNGAAAWDTVLKFLNPTAFDTPDPIFQEDISFYLFRLPLYRGLQGNCAELLIWAIVLSIGVYALKGEIRPERGWKYFLTGEVKTHLCLLLAGLALVISAGFYLERYELLFSPTGVVFGAGYTDVHANLHAYWTMAFVTLAVAALFILSLWRSGFLLPIVGIGFYIVVLIGVNGIYPWLQQKLVVEPNELTKERPFIESNLAFTRAAYDLADVESSDFPAESNLDRAALTRNAPTIDNIRLWDYRPILSTYQQLQEIRLYYSFGDVDIDRYVLNGDYRQVVIAAREMDYTQASPEAQTWVNQRLKFTHGYGVVMSPVNEVTPDGLPRLLIQNVPPVSSVDLDIEEPRLYYGEATRSYVFTGTETDEFDYPDGDNNAANRYSGVGGVPMGSFWQRLAYAYDLGSFKILISNYFSRDSRIHYHRQVVERARHIAPFLTYDSDPYIAIVNGRLKWILDAYTTTNRYPYSEPLGRSGDVQAILNSPVISGLARSGVNYLRDAAKVVIDAYDGTVQFYGVDEMDPILATYRKIFPALFLSQDAVPEDLAAHFRYPYDLFKVQAQMYRVYHMGNPEVFYNREDVWRFPMQVYEGSPVLMEPYYIIMRLPEAEQEEFIQILPFTPLNRDNMVAWMAGRSDGDRYGRLLLYEFPKQQLVFGPSQIEARINQTPEISEQLTLWSQEGSRVIRGDMMVIPIERSLLYVEPVYLRAEQGALPELRRVIAVYDNQVAMEPTLDAALNRIFGDRPATTPEPASSDESDSVTTTPPPGLVTRVQAALDAYEAGQQALQQGDWEAYGRAQRQLETVLRQLEQETDLSGN